MSDANGFKRGAKGIDGRKGEDFLDSRGGNDFANMSDYHDNSSKPIRTIEWDKTAEWGFSGVVSRGGPPRYARKSPSSIKPVDAASPSGKYAKPGGSGQRSGA